MANDKGRINAFTPLARHPVAAFLILAFLISWGGVLTICLPTGIPGEGEALDTLIFPVFLAMLAGPFLSALFMSFALGGGAAILGLLRSFTIWRAKPVDYAAAFLLIPACALAVLLPLSLVSPDFTPGFVASDGALSVIALSLAGGFAVGIIEESGWTGFAAPRLLRNHSVLAVGIGLGIVHAVWHFPVTVWFEGAEFGLVIIPYLLTAWVLAIIVLRILTVWVFARTGSTLLAAIAHASHTGWLQALWPRATSPVQDVLWTAAFGALGLFAVLMTISVQPPNMLKSR